MKAKILERLDNYKKHRQEYIEKQNNYLWTKEELDKESETYGMYQNRESLFTIKILELEWVLKLMKMEI